MRISPLQIKSITYDYKTSTIIYLDDSNRVIFSKRGTLEQFGANCKAWLDIKTKELM